MSFAGRIDLVRTRLESAGLSREEEVTLRQEETLLATVSRLLERLMAVHGEIAECEMLAATEEAEMREMALEEKAGLLAKLRDVEQQLIDTLLVEDEDASEAVVEVRAGTGGSEAQLFAWEVMEMYRKYCLRRKWKFDLSSLADGELPGTCREATAIIKGEGVYGELRFEGGVHRVQRKPLTDKTRVHTSTVTVAVLPSVMSIDEQIPDSDLVIETTRARGAGGQHVNTTDSAIRVTHIPTGITVSMQDDRSQHRNKAQALQIITAKVIALRKRERDAARSEQRRSMIGSGDRSERIRTYNFPQDRITDHRIQFSEMGVEAMLNGQFLDDFSERLQQLYTRERLQSVLENTGSGQ